MAEVFIEIAGYKPQHLSYSTVSGYRMCGAKFGFEKVMGLEQRPGLAALGGNAVHTATEALDMLILSQGWETLEPAPTEPPF